MTVPENLATRYGSIDHPCRRVQARKASVCSSSPCVSHAAPSLMPIPFASYLYRVRLPFDPPAITSALAPQTRPAGIEIP
jgi:hypothetical protein